jgi:hypothetical protein
MDWNQMQGFYMPQQQNNTFTNPYMQQLQGMLGMFSNQYGGPNRQPTLPQFSSYNPGFGGPTSFFDQMRGGGSDPYAAYLEYQQNNPNGTDPGFNIGGPGQRAATLSREQYSQWLRDTASGMYDNMYPDPYTGRGGGMGGGGGLPPGYSYDAPGDRSYTMEMPTNGGRWAYGPNGERIEVGGRQGPGADYFRNLFEGGGGGMYGREYDRRAAYEHARQQPDFDWENYGESMDGPRMPYGSNGGGFGGRGGYPQMPQFNPYMLARNNMMGMGFNEMFDPRFAMLFGMGGLGAMRPQGFAATQPQQPPSTANGQKPLAIGGGGDSSGMQRNPAGFLEPTAPYGSQDYWRSRYDQYYRDLESGGWFGGGG